MKRALSLILVLVMAAALLVCPAMADGGNGSGGGNGQNPLNVASVKIGDRNLAGAIVNREGVITIVFDRGMDKNSEATVGVIYIENVVAVTRFEGDRTFTVTFSELPKGDYTLVIGKDAMANNGNTLGEDYRVNFTVDYSGEEYGETCPSDAFTDVDRSLNSWYHYAVDWAVSHGITKGTSATEFSPLKACTRAEAVTFLYRAAGSPSVAGLKNTFKDVKASDYYYDAVLWAVSKGVTNGDGAADTFNPNGVCTRAHIVTFLFRAAGSPELFDAELTYRDVPAGTWYTVPVIWADSRGITKGDGAPDIFNPNGSCTRAMIVTFLYRASK